MATKAAVVHAVFVGTHVPAQLLHDYLPAGDTLDRCLDQFPTVGRQARTVGQMAWPGIGSSELLTPAAEQLDEEGWSQRS